MTLFKSIGNDLSYTDIIQLDGCFSVAHINYGESPLFNGVDGKQIAVGSRQDKISSKEHIEDVIDMLTSFDGTEVGFDAEDRIELWKSYWVEYIKAFDKMTTILPNSIVTLFIGRQAIEVGIKYLLLRKEGEIFTKHDLWVLASKLFDEYDIKDDYMKHVQSFCGLYSKYIEGEKPEYFRFPEYKQNKYFAGNSLDIKWLSYNLALILLKLIHFAGIESEF